MTTKPASRTKPQGARTADRSDVPMMVAAAPDASSEEEASTRRGRGQSRKTFVTRQAILEAAARVFTVYGYEAATVRDIAAAVNLLPGSLYHHFGSKDEIIAQAYRAGVDHIIQAVQSAIEPLSDPWERLEAACCAHIETLTNESGPFAGMLSKDLPATSPELLSRLVVDRDRYDKVFGRLVCDLDGISPRDAKLLRLQILGSLNWTTRWFKKGGRLKASDVGKAFVRNLRGVCRKSRPD